MYTWKSALNFADEASASAATAAAAAAAVANIAADIVLDVSRLDVSSSSALRGFRSSSSSSSCLWQESREVVLFQAL